MPPNLAARIYPMWTQLSEEGADFEARLAAVNSLTSVLSNGAVGDGVTDDTAAVHLARAAAGPGGTVYFPAGRTYLVTGITANVARQRWIIEKGATVKLKGVAISAPIFYVTADGVAITGDGILDGDKASQVVNNCFGVRLTDTSSNCVVDVATIQNTGAAGVFIEGGAGHRIRPRLLSACGSVLCSQVDYAQGVRFAGTTDLEIDGITMTTPFYGGVKGTTYLGARNTDVRITRNRVTGVGNGVPGSASIGIGVGQCDGLRVQHNRVDWSTAGNCIDINGSTQVHDTDNTVLNSATYGLFFGDNAASKSVVARNIGVNCASGIQVVALAGQTVADLEVVDNLFTGLTTTGAEFRANGGTMTDTVIARNRFAGAPSNHAVILWTSAGGTLTDVDFADNFLGGRDLAISGANVSKLRVRGNRIRGSATQGINVDASGVSGLRFSLNHVSGSTNEGVAIAPAVNATDVSFDGDLIESSGSVGLRANGVDGLRFRATSRNNASVGLYLQKGSKAHVITGSRLSDDQGVPTQTYGLQVHATDFTLIDVDRGVEIRGNVTGPSTGGSIPASFTSLDTTPSVGFGTVFLCANAGATAITTFDDGYSTQVIDVKLDANTTLVHGATLKLAGGVNLVGTANDMVTLRNIAGVWYEVSRSVNG